MLILSSKLQNIKPSITLLLAAKSNQLKKQGQKIISFGVGEPDFDTPDNIKLAAIKGIIEGKTKYTNADGTPELKAAIQQKFKRENNLDYQADEIIVSCGGKQVIYNLFMATLNPEDEVILPIPYWVSYPEMISLCSGKSVFAKCDDQLKLSPEELESKITSKTKWLVLNSPNNPSGMCYTKQELVQLAKVLERHKHVYVMCDDIYEHIVFDDMKFITLAQAAPELKERVFIVNGVSKGYAMTGWRIGYGAGDKKIIAGMGIIQSQSTSNPSSISQIAAIEALNGRQDFIKTNNSNFQIKRDTALDILKQSPMLKCTKPDGAFYLFIDCTKLIGKTTPDGQIIASADDFCSFLLQEAKVAVVPGGPFGMDGFFRLSFATSLENITQGCEQIVRVCENLA